MFLMKSNKIKVLLDVSVLAELYLRKKTSGVDRVTLEMCKVFSEYGGNDTDISVSFISLIHSEWNAYQFLKKQNFFSPQQFVFIKNPYGEKIKAFFWKWEFWFKEKQAVATSKTWEEIFCVFKKTVRMLRLLSEKIFRGKKVKSVLEKYDIVHSPVYSLRSIENCDVKKVLTIHDMIPLALNEYKGRLHNHSWFKEIIDYTTSDYYIVAISEHTKRDVFTFLPTIPREQVYKVCNSIDHRLFMTNTSTSLANKFPQLLETDQFVVCLCKLEPRKNIISVVRGFIEMKNRLEDPSLKLVLIGQADNAYQKTYHEIISAIEGRDDIVVTGYLDDDEVKALYRQAIVFINLSLYEGFGMPILEAMAAGLPIIASNVTSHPEVVGDAGILVNPLDIRKIAEALFAICVDEEMRISLSEKNKKQLMKFTNEVFYQEMKKVYLRVHSHNKQS